MQEPPRVAGRTAPLSRARGAPVLAWLLACACLACAGEPPGGNVLLLIADDLAVDRIGAYGSDTAPPTPNLDALAARGVVFDRAYSPAMCSPSRAAMLTGRHPRRFGLGGQINQGRDLYEVPLSEVTIPEVLDRSPLHYSNAALGKWHLASFLSLSAGLHPLASGFDWYAGSFGNFRSTTRKTERRKGYSYWEKDTNGAFRFVETYATTDTVDDALAAIARLPGPWFLWVAFNAVHFPFHDPPDHLHTRPSLDSKAAQLDAMVEALDAEIGRLLGSMDPAVLSETSVIFVGDNGAPSWRLDPPDDAGRENPKWQRRIDAHSKGTLYEAGIRVPLIVAGPLVREPGSRSEALVHVMDVFATTAEIGGVDPKAIRGPDGRIVPIDGISLLPYLEDPRHPSRRSIVYQDQFRPNGPGPYALDVRMVRGDRYKLIEDAARGVYRFFDLEDRVEEGPDLFPHMDAEQRKAFEELKHGLDRTLAAIEAGEVVEDPGALDAGRGW